MTTTAIVTDAGTALVTRHRDPETPRGADWARDGDPAAIRACLDALEESKGQERAAFFDLALEEDGATWRANGMVCGALYGVIATALTPGGLLPCWTAAARRVLRAIESGEAA